MRIQKSADLGQIIRQRREAAGLTIEMAATLARVSRRLLTELELGTRRNVSFGAVIQITEILGLNIEVRPRGLPGVSSERKPHA